VRHAQGVTYRGDLEADACGLGFGGFFTAGTNMHYFFGTWSAAELASFESNEPRTLNINALSRWSLSTSLYTLAPSL
jgi:hypothetical protein